jgi:WD40 repeat protein
MFLFWADFSHFYFSIKLWDLKAQMSIKTYKGIITFLCLYLLLISYIAHNNGVTSISFNRNDDQCFLSCSQVYR